MMSTLRELRCVLCGTRASGQYWLDQEPNPLAPLCDACAELEEERGSVVEELPTSRYDETVRDALGRRFAAPF